MSAHPEILNLPTQATATQTTETTPPPQARKRRARNGKVAHLPYAVRLKINHMLDDAFHYEKLIENLGPDGVGLTIHHISEWKLGGYQDYLLDTFWQNEMRARQETFTGLLAGADPVSLPEGGLQVAVTGICELLRDLCQSDTEGQTDPNTYVRVANSLARLSRSVLTLQEYRDATAKAAAAQLSRKDPNREFNDAEYDLVTDRMDDFFRKPRRRRAQAGTATVAVPDPQFKVQGSGFEVQSSPSGGQAAETTATVGQASPGSPKRSEGGSLPHRASPSRIGTAPPAVRSDLPWQRSRPRAQNRAVPPRQIPQPV